MTLHLYYHPLSSFCHKVMIALYENDTPWEAHVVNLGEPEDRAAFLKLWPIGKFPVIRDDKRNDWVVPESTTIIEYLDQHYPGRTKFVPDDPDLARQVRFFDRFFDHYLHHHMQKVTGDRLRPEVAKDAEGVQQARDAVAVALGMVEQHMANKTWAVGDQFTMADISAAPALFYVDMNVTPLKGAYPVSLAYLERLKQRPSYARTLQDAEPFMHMVPRG